MSEFVYMLYDVSTDKIRMLSKDINKIKKSALFISNNENKDLGIDLYCVDIELDKLYGEGIDKHIIEECNIIELSDK